jgi:signal peptidase
MSVPLVAISSARRMLDGLLLVLIAVTFGTILISRVIPAVSGASTFVVRGSSMEPAIHLGSVVVAERVRVDDLKVGDIVSVQVGSDKAVFTHRITRLVPRADGLWIQTRGDANPGPDPSIIPATAVIGRATMWLPLAGYLIALLATPMGIALMVSIAGSLLAGAWFLEALEETRRYRRQRARADGIGIGELRIGHEVTG